VALYAIGDVQGCFRTLQRLLHRIGFDPPRDRLWLVGDLVNRGPRSLDVLRWARRAGDALAVVLGNHDLHLIGRALGTRRERARDTLDDVLHARDREALVDWLRRRPILHREADRVMVHAGLLPSWTPGEAESLARAAEAETRAPDPAAWLRDGAFEPPAWDPALSPRKRLRLAVHAFTSLRTCSPEGRPCRGFTGPPEQAPKGCLAWFAVPGRRSASATVVCGHWSALGLRLEPGIVALDTGCVWGRSLTAVRLDDRTAFQEPMAD